MNRHATDTGEAVSRARLSWRPGRAAASLLMAVAATAGGCKTPSAAQPPVLEPPAYQAIAEAHNQRLAKLQTVYANGVIEIRWRDVKGKHFEQGNMELWLQLPRRTALRVEKLGEVIFWLGSDDERFWLFDLVDQEKNVRIGRHDQTDFSAEGGALEVKPLALLDLLALAPLPASGPAPSVEFDSRFDAWAVEAQGGGGRMRMYFDRATMLPKRVESLAADGTVTLSSTLCRYESVRLKNTSPLNFPKMAQLMDIVGTSEQAGADGLVGGEVKLAVNSADGYAESDQLDRVFDLQRLIQGLRPARIDDGRQSQASSNFPEKSSD